MSFKDILVPVLAVDEDEPALSLAEMIAARLRGSVRALLVNSAPQPMIASDAGPSGFAWAELLEAERDQFRREKSSLDARANRSPVSMLSSDHATIFGALGAEVAAEARCADVTVLLQPSAGHQAVRTEMFEGTLFGAGRPVLLVPREWVRRPVGDNILIAWNGKREAARALGDAAPLLESGEKVTLASVSARKDQREHAATSAEQVMAHMRRRGLNAHYRELSPIESSEAAALFAEAKALGADLMVMGGYGRSRLREFVFGGVTREAIKSAPLPLLMSH